jgi:hypothetical protein
MPVKHMFKATALVLALALAPAAQATEPSRDTGVGKVIAAQGNQALRAIRDEAVARVKAVMPRLPAPAARVVKMSQPAGSTIAQGATVACEQ